MFLYSVLVRNVVHKYAVKNDFNKSNIGVENEKYLCYTNELLHVMIYVTFCAIHFVSDCNYGASKLRIITGSRIFLQAFKISLIFNKSSFLNRISSDIFNQLIHTPIFKSYLNIFFLHTALIWRSMNVFQAELYSHTLNQNRTFIPPLFCLTLWG